MEAKASSVGSARRSPFVPLGSGQTRCYAAPAVAIPIVLYLVALAVRLAAGLAFTGPAYLDSYYYVDVARQLAAGHGLNVDFIWAFVEVGGHIPAHGILPVPSNAHWLPLASLVQVPFIWLLGPTALASALPFWLIGAAAAPLTWAIGRDAGLGRGACVAAALLMAVPGALTPFMSQPDNFGLYGPLGAAALWACARGLRGSRRAFVAGGLLVGLASLARNDGILLGLPFAGAFLLERWRTRPSGALAPGPVGWRAALACAGAFAIVMLPWYARQVAVFGSPMPSAATGRILWITDYTQLFGTVGTPTLSTFLAQGWGSLLLSRLLGFVAAAGLFAYMPFALVLAPCFALGAWLRRRDPSFAPWLTYALTLLAFSSLLFALHVPSGNFIHSAVALLPHAYLLLTVGIACAVAWVARRRPSWDAVRATRVFTAAAVALTVTFATASTLSTVASWNAERATLAPIDAALADQPLTDRVMSADPSGLWYATGRPGVMTPADPLPVVEHAARVYGIRWLVLEAAHVVPSLQPVLGGQVRPAWLSSPVLTVPGQTGAVAAALYAVCLRPQDPRCGR